MPYKEVLTFDWFRESLGSIRKILVATSGGLDSMVLLHLCNQLTIHSTLGFQIEVAHVDHGTRVDNFLDFNLIKSICIDNNIPFNSCKLESCPQNENFESWARKKRYDYFLSVLKDKNLEFVFTAHHARDVVETFLMRLFSNKDLRTIQKTVENKKIFRPLLCISWDAIYNYALVNSVSYREDSTNADVSLLRNRVRHRLLPQIEGNFGKSSISAIFNGAVKTANSLVEIESSAFALIKSINVFPFGSKEWRHALVSELERNSTTLGKTLLDLIMHEKLKKRLGDRHLDRLYDFFINNRTSIQLPGGVAISRLNGSIRIIRQCDETNKS
jgi:tRNA(Ile)-lysidine synthetase-like protein